MIVKMYRSGKDKGRHTLKLLSLGLGIADLMRPDSISIPNPGIGHVLWPISSQCLCTIREYHTGLLNISLLDAAAIPVGTLAVFCLHADTPLTARGSGIGTAEVSVTPTRLTSRGAGGLILGSSVNVECGIGGCGTGGVCGEVCGGAIGL